MRARDKSQEQKPKSKSQEQITAELQNSAEKCRKNIDLIMSIARARGLPTESPEYQQLEALLNLFQIGQQLLKASGYVEMGLQMGKAGLAYKALGLSGKDWWPNLLSSYAVAISYEFNSVLQSINREKDQIAALGNEASSLLGLLKGQIKRINPLAYDVSRKCKVVVENPLTTEAVGEEEKFKKEFQKKIENEIKSLQKLKDGYGILNKIVALIERQNFEEFLEKIYSFKQKPGEFLREIKSVKKELEAFIESKNHILSWLVNNRNLPLAYQRKTQDGNEIVSSIRGLEGTQNQQIKIINENYLSLDDGSTYLNIVKSCAYIDFFEKYKEFFKDGSLNQKRKSLEGLKNFCERLDQDIELDKSRIINQFKELGLEEESYVDMYGVFYKAAAAFVVKNLEAQIRKSTEILKNDLEKQNILLEKLNSSYHEIDEIISGIKNDANSFGLLMSLKSKINVLNSEKDSYVDNFRKFLSDHHISAEELISLHEDKELQELFRKHEGALQALHTAPNLKSRIEEFEKTLLSNVKDSLQKYQTTLDILEPTMKEIRELHGQLQKEKTEKFTPGLPFPYIKGLQEFRNKLANSHGLPKARLEAYYLENNNRLVDATERHIQNQSQKLEMELTALKKAHEDLISNKTKLNLEIELKSKDLKETETILDSENTILSWINPWGTNSNLGLKIKYDRLQTELEELNSSSKKIEEQLSSLDSLISEKEKFKEKFDQDADHIRLLDKNIIESTNALIGERNKEVLKKEQRFLKKCAVIEKKLEITLDLGKTAESAYSQLETLSSELKNNKAYFSFRNRLNEISSCVDFTFLANFPSKIESLHDDIHRLELEETTLIQVSKEIQALRAEIQSSDENLSPRMNEILEDLKKLQTNISNAHQKMEASKALLQTHKEIAERSKNIDVYLKGEFLGALEAYPENETEDILARVQHGDYSDLNEYVSAREDHLNNLSLQFKKECSSLRDLGNNFIKNARGLGIEISEEKINQLTGLKELDDAIQKIDEKVQTWNIFKRNNLVIKAEPLEAADQGKILLHYKVDYFHRSPRAGFENQKFKSCLFIIGSEKNLKGAKFEADCDLDFGTASNFKNIEINEETQMDFKRYGSKILLQNSHKLLNDEFERLLNIMKNDRHSNLKYSPNAKDVLALLREIGQLDISLADKKTCAMKLVDIMLPKIHGAPELIKFKELVATKHDGDQNPYAYIRQERGTFRSQYGNTRTWDHVIGKVQDQFQEKDLVSPGEYREFYDIMKTRRTHTYGFGSLFQSLGAKTGQWKNPKGDLSSAFNEASNEKGVTELSQHKK